MCGTDSVTCCHLLLLLEHFSAGGEPQKCRLCLVYRNACHSANEVYAAGVMMTLSAQGALYQLLCFQIYSGRLHSKVRSGKLYRFVTDSTRQDVPSVPHKTPASAGYTCYMVTLPSSFGSPSYLLHPRQVAVLYHMLQEKF